MNSASELQVGSPDGGTAANTMTVVSGQGQGKPNRAPWLRSVIALIVVAPPAAGWLVWRGRSQAAGLLPSLVALAVFWVVVLVVLEAAGRSDSNPLRRKYGFLNVVIGSDGRVSTSKTVAIVWTAIFASALMILSGLKLFGHVAGSDQFVSAGSSWDAYLLLLGGPYAAAVLAKGIVSGKTQGNPSSKSQLPTASSTANASTVVDGTPSPKDLVSGDTGSLDLVDTQFSVFSLVAIFYFAGAFVSNVISFADGAKTVELPAIPSVLLGLTSLAALTYVGNKAVQTQGVSIAILRPKTAGPGKPVTATLVNLPSSAAVENVWVIAISANGEHPRRPTAVDVKSGAVTFNAPPVRGAYQVTILAPDSYTARATLTVSG